jgi:hypothetical protein
MKQPNEDEPLDLDHLREELHQLARRVDALEHRAVDRPAPAAPMPDLPSILGTDVALPATNPIPAAGRAVLGLAGAFLLRALAESGSVPSLLVVGVAIVYAATWLVFSVRTREQNAFAGTAYGITAALILAPLLWEATVRFHALPPPATAAILVAFLMLSSVLAWSKISAAVTTVTTLSTLITAIALMIQTGDLVPFALALLGIACVIEASAAKGHARNMRIPAALAADFGIWLIYYIMTRSALPEHYKAVAVSTGVALGVLLFALYATAIVYRTVVLRETIGIFEIVQSVAVFVLAAGGAFRLTEGRAASAVGALCAIACAACYFTAFIRFAEKPRRNHHVFAALGAALGLTACILILPDSQLTLIWSAAAVLSTLAGARASLATLVIHGGVYLLAAGVTSAIPGTLLNAFTGASLERPSAALWIIAISAACCYAACYTAKPSRAIAGMSFLSALLAALSIAALAILLAASSLGDRLTLSLLATARTLVTCAVALSLAFTGSRTGRRELVWIGYIAIALGTLKLILEDFRQSNPVALAVSLVCYGALLIVVPKLSSKPASR